MIWHKISCVAVSRTLFATGFSISWLTSLVVFSTNWWHRSFELSYIYCNTRAKLSASSYSFCFIITLDRSLKFMCLPPPASEGFGLFTFWDLLCFICKCETSTWKQWVKLLIGKVVHWTSPESILVWNPTQSKSYLNICLCSIMLNNKHISTTVQLVVLHYTVLPQGIQNNTNQEWFWGYSHH